MVEPLNFCPTGGCNWLGLLWVPLWSIGTLVMAVVASSVVMAIEIYETERRIARVMRAIRKLDKEDD